MFVFLADGTCGSGPSSGDSSAWKWLNFFNVYNQYKTWYNYWIHRISTFIEEETK